MGSIITRADSPKLDWPGLKHVFGTIYKSYSDKGEWRQLFDVEKSDKAYEEEVAMVGWGPAQLTDESSQIPYFTSKQGYVCRHTNLKYAAAFSVSKEEVEDNLYPKVSRDRSRLLAFSLAQRKELVAAAIFNSAFVAPPVYGDGQPLISDSHPIDGGVFSNTFDTAMPLSELALEQAYIDISRFVDNAGNIIMTRPISLHVPPSLFFVAVRILKNTQWRPGTAERDINALVVSGTYPGGIKVHHFFDSPTAFFIKTDCPVGLVCYERTGVEFEEDNNFQNKTLMYSATERYSMGPRDPRCLYGSAGC